MANLDTYGGNSGSPVFNEVSNVCPTTGCRGEDVTRTTEFADSVPENPIVPQPDLENRVGNLERVVESIGAIY